MSIPEPQHFSDYGFDSQFDCFQIIEEAKKHKRESKPIDSLHLKLQKPISKDSERAKKRKSSWLWWKNPLFFLKWRRTDHSSKSVVDHHRRRQERPVSGPVYYVAEAPARWSFGRCGRSGPLERVGGFEVPYVSLREVNVDRPTAVASTPIYFVT
ncbi:hypothetical protein QJS10_CPB04g00933 [Acorus calamus]|uniref:Uncharacterized protein n=1 Tax=Acorus calamus TaxID=4465 RepID=A0AAV9EYL3_ACOCL|nr:hypothetical protein QJS10_CPB04g00933 [Acorus calamus]